MSTRYLAQFASDNALILMEYEATFLQLIYYSYVLQLVHVRYHLIFM